MQLAYVRALTKDDSPLAGGFGLKNITNTRRARRVGRLVASGLLLVVAGGCGPVWYLDATFPERVAKQENRPLLYYFKAWDSTQHRNMWLKVFQDPAVKTELMDTVNVELEFAYYPRQANRYGVRQPQVCVMCKPDGLKVLSSMYVNPVPKKEEFLDWLRRAKAAATPKPTTAQTTAAPTTAATTVPATTRPAQGGG